MLKKIESVILFVADIDAAARWYSTLLNLPIEYENPQYAFIKTPSGNIGFHPLDVKNPGGIGGATVYWEVENLDAAIVDLQAQGATLYRGPMTTSFGAKAAMLIDPYGCTLGINQAPSCASLSVE